MTVPSVRTDVEHLTMTIVAEFDATPDRVWELWADARQFERWWGPPGLPATVTRHELWPGGRIEYHMTGPDGIQVRAYLEVVTADPPNGLVLRDGYVADDGAPAAEPPPNELRVTIEAVGAGVTRMLVETLFPSPEQMEQYLAMGMAEGFAASVGQIDAILAAPA
jgi:uncharacterized protein YndB with AHSA1/START domain